MLNTSVARSKQIFAKSSFVGRPLSQLNADVQIKFKRYLASSDNIANSDGKSVINYKSAYVHPLSQIVLEHLQNSCSEWVSKVGLDKGGLTLNKDGTFLLKFPTGSGESGTKGEIW